MAMDMNQGVAAIRSLLKGALLHDIGKIGISDNILLKRGKLTPEEFEVIKTHVTIGCNFVSDAVWLGDGLDVILYHHEKYNGTGYCKSLKGDEIPLLARIFAITDVFDALTTDRPYKRAMSYDEAMKIILSDTGTHFDPEITETFTNISLDMFERFGNRNDESVEEHSMGILIRYFSANSSGDSLVNCTNIE
jgi:HD-GYP domain-containing protein (c-di-GMP phosphodiesterase class II)